MSTQPIVAGTLWRVARFLQPVTPRWLDDRLHRLAVRGACRDLDRDQPGWDEPDWDKS